MFDYIENRSTKEIKAYYTWFHENLLFLLEKAGKLLSKQSLDFSVEEIDQLGKYIKEKLDAGLEFDKQSILIKEELANIFIAYYGAAWMHYFGGKWYYSTKKSEYGFGFPMIIEYGPPGAMWTALMPYDYLIMTLDGRMDKLSELFVQEFRLFERKGITDYKR